MSEFDDPLEVALARLSGSQGETDEDPLDAALARISSGEQVETKSPGLITSAANQWDKVTSALSGPLTPIRALLQAPAHYTTALGAEVALPEAAERLRKERGLLGADNSLHEIADAPLAGDIIMEHFLPGEQTNPWAKLGKNVGSLVGDIALDPISWTGELATQIGDLNKVNKAGEVVQNLSRVMPGVRTAPALIKAAITGSTEAGKFVDLEKSLEAAKVAGKAVGAVPSMVAQALSGRQRLALGALGLSNAIIPPAAALSYGPGAISGALHGIGEAFDADTWQERFASGIQGTLDTGLAAMMGHGLHSLVAKQQVDPIQAMKAKAVAKDTSVIQDMGPGPVEGKIKAAMETDLFRAMGKAQEESGVNPLEGMVDPSVLVGEILKKERYNYFIAEAQQAFGGDARTVVNSAIQQAVDNVTRHFHEVSKLNYSAMENQPQATFPGQVEDLPVLAPPSENVGPAGRTRGPSRPPKATTPPKQVAPEVIQEAEAPSAPPDAQKEIARYEGLIKEAHALAMALPGGIENPKFQMLKGKIAQFRQSIAKLKAGEQVESKPVTAPAPVEVAPIESSAEPIEVEPLPETPALLEGDAKKQVEEVARLTQALAREKAAVEREHPESTAGMIARRRLGEIQTRLKTLGEGSQPASEDKPETPKFITRDHLKANPDKVFLFGDNLQQRGYGGQAKEMRGEPNAIGIPTKKAPSMDERAFFNDAEFEANKKAIDAALAKIPKGKEVIVPEAGLGTGLADLERRAPKTNAYLQEQLRKFNQKEVPSNFEIVHLPFGAPTPKDVINGHRAGGKNVTNAKPGEPGALGNPFIANDVRGGTLPREQAQAKFAQAFRKRIAEDPEYRDWVLSLRGKKVGYYKPNEKFIHLQEVQKWLREQAGEKPEKPTPAEPSPLATLPTDNRFPLAKIEPGQLTDAHFDKRWKPLIDGWAETLGPNVTKHDPGLKPLMAAIERHREYAPKTMEYLQEKIAEHIGAGDAALDRLNKLNSKETPAVSAYVRKLRDLPRLDNKEVSENLSKLGGLKKAAERTTDKSLLSAYHAKAMEIRDSLVNHVLAPIADYVWYRSRGIRVGGTSVKAYADVLKDAHRAAVAEITKIVRDGGMKTNDAMNFFWATKKKIKDSFGTQVTGIGGVVGLRVKSAIDSYSMENKLKGISEEDIPPALKGKIHVDGIPQDLARHEARFKALERELGREPSEEELVDFWDKNSSLDKEKDIRPRVQFLEKLRARPDIEGERDGLGENGEGNIYDKRVLANIPDPQETQLESKIKAEDELDAARKLVTKFNKALKEGKVPDAEREKLQNYVEEQLASAELRMMHEGGSVPEASVEATPAPRPDSSLAAPIVEEALPEQGKKPSPAPAPAEVIAREKAVKTLREKVGQPMQNSLQRLMFARDKKLETLEKAPAAEKAFWDQFYKKKLENLRNRWLRRASDLLDALNVPQAEQEDLSARALPSEEAKANQLRPGSKPSELTSRERIPTSEELNTKPEGIVARRKNLSTPKGRIEEIHAQAESFRGAVQDLLNELNNEENSGEKLSAVDKLNRIQAKEILGGRVTKDVNNNFTLDSRGDKVLDYLLGVWNEAAVTGKLPASREKAIPDTQIPASINPKNNTLMIGGATYKLVFRDVEVNRNQLPAGSLEALKAGERRVENPDGSYTTYQVHTKGDNQTIKVRRPEIIQLTDSKGNRVIAENRSVPPLPNAMGYGRPIIDHEGSAFGYISDDLRGLPKKTRERLEALQRRNYYKLRDEAPAIERRLTEFQDEDNYKGSADSARPQLRGVETADRSGRLERLPDDQSEAFDKPFEELSQETAIKDRPGFNRLLEASGLEHLDPTRLSEKEKETQLTKDSKKRHLIMTQLREDGHPLWLIQQATRHLPIPGESATDYAWRKLNNSLREDYYGSHRGSVESKEELGTTGATAASRREALDKAPEIDNAKGLYVSNPEGAPKEVVESAVRNYGDLANIMRGYSQKLAKMYKIPSVFSGFTLEEQGGVNMMDRIKQNGIGQVLSNPWAIARRAAASIYIDAEKAGRKADFAAEFPIAFARQLKELLVHEITHGHPNTWQHLPEGIEFHTPEHDRLQIAMRRKAAAFDNEFIGAILHALKDKDGQLLDILKGDLGELQGHWNEVRPDTANLRKFADFRTWLFGPESRASQVLSSASKAGGAGATSGVRESEEDNGFVGGEDNSVEQSGEPSGEPGGEPEGQGVGVSERKKAALQDRFNRYTDRLTELEGKEEPTEQEKREVKYLNKQLGEIQDHVKNALFSGDEEKAKEWLAERDLQPASSEIETKNDADDYFKRLGFTVDYNANIPKTSIKLGPRLIKIPKGAETDVISAAKQIKNYLGEQPEFNHVIDTRAQIESDPLAKIIVHTLASKPGWRLTGSPAYALQGTLKRPEAATFHDIDMQTGVSRQEAINTVKTLIPEALIVRHGNTGMGDTVAFLIPGKGYKVVTGKDTPWALKDLRTGKITDWDGKPDQRIRALDIFPMRNTEDISINIGGKDINIARADHPMNAKAAWGRPKDKTDIANFRYGPGHRTLDKDFIAFEEDRPDHEYNAQREYNLKYAKKVVSQNSKVEYKGENKKAQIYSKTAQTYWNLPPELDKVFDENPKLRDHHFGNENIARANGWDEDSITAYRLMLNEMAKEKTFTEPRPILKVIGEMESLLKDKTTEEITADIRNRMDKGSVTDLDAVTLVHLRNLAKNNANFAKYKLQDALRSDKNVETFKKKYERAMEEFTNVAYLHRESSTRVGRALRAFNTYVKNVDPELDHLARLKRVLRERGKSENDIKALMDAYQNAPESFPTLLAMAMDAKWSDKLLEAWSAGLISGPVTRVTNFTSNAFYAALRDVEHYAAAHLEGLKGEDRKRFTEESRWAMLGARMALPVAFRSWLNNHGGYRAKPMQIDWTGRPFERRGGETALGSGKERIILGKSGKHSIPNPWQYLPLIGNKHMGEFITMAFKGLEVDDNLFKTFSGYKHTGRIAYRMFMDEVRQGNVPKEMEETWVRQRMQDLIEARSQRPGEPLYDKYVSSGAIKEINDNALEDTFQEDLHGWTASIQKSIDSHKLFRFIVPFYKTPINILKEGAKRTPLGFLPGAGFWSALKQFKEGKGEEHAVAAEEIAKRTVGNTIVAAATLLAGAGMITGSGPTDQKAKNLKMRTGWRPYSIKVGDQYFAYNRIEPLSTLLGTAADMAEAITEGDTKSADKFLSKASAAATGNLTNKSFIAGMEGFMSALEDPDRNMKTFLKSFEGSLVPNIVAATAKTIDPEVKQTDFKNVVQSRIPFLSKSVEAKRDATGEPILYPGTAPERFASPFTRSPVRTDASAKVAEVLETIGYVPAPPPDFLKLPGGSSKIMLTKEERNTLFTAREKATAKVSQVINDPTFRALPDNEEAPDFKPGRTTKRDVLQKFYRRYLEEAVARIKPAVFRRYGQ